MATEHGYPSIVFLLYSFTIAPFKIPCEGKHKHMTLESRSLIRERVLINTQVEGILRNDPFPRVFA